MRVTRLSVGAVIAVLLSTGSDFAEALEDCAAALTPRSSDAFDAFTASLPSQAEKQMRTGQACVAWAERSACSPQAIGLSRRRRSGGAIPPATPCKDDSPRARRLFSRRDCRAHVTLRAYSGTRRVERNSPPRHPQASGHRLKGMRAPFARLQRLASPSCWTVV